MLKDREIDLLADVSMTSNRQNQMLFSAYAIGMENYYLYVSDQVCEVDALDYTTLNGKKIGINANSVQQKQFEEWAETNGVTAVIVPCDGDSAIVEKLNTGELECMTCSIFLRFHMNSEIMYQTIRSMYLTSAIPLTNACWNFQKILPVCF